MDSRDESRSSPTSSPFYEGRIVGTASSATDTLLVTLDRFGESPFGDPEGVVWAPRVDDHGDPVYPESGDWCLAVESDAGQWCVLLWAPS